jgi:uncharacterized protein YcnI
MHQRTLSICVAFVFAAAAPLAGQVTMDPTTMPPAGMARMALRVVNQSDTAITHVRLTVPEAIGVLGVDAPEGWSFQIQRATDSTPQTIEWTGASLAQWEFREFPFFGRLAADARRKELVFPVAVTRANGGVTKWDWVDGMGQPPIIMIVGSTRVSAWGTFALAGAALGISILALGMAIGRRKGSGTTQERYLGRTE